MRLHTGGCADTVRESALDVDSGRKIPCLTGDSNTRQYYAWLFSQSDALPTELFPLFGGGERNVEHVLGTVVLSGMSSLQYVPSVPSRKCAYL